MFAAEAERARYDGEPAYVLAGEGWHPGVIGIVASRIVERHHRPTLLIALDGESGRGSGRSIGPYDLHAGLAACSEHLVRFGGHRAAAGFEVAADRVDALRRAFVHHAASALTPRDLIPEERVDALVPGTALGLDLAEELGRLEPFGMGNPQPTLLVPAARVGDARSMGEEGQHCRFTLSSGGRSRPRRGVPHRRRQHQRLRRRAARRGAAARAQPLERHRGAARGPARAVRRRARRGRGGGGGRRLLGAARGWARR